MTSNGPMGNDSSIGDDQSDDDGEKYNETAGDGVDSEHIAGDLAGTDDIDGRTSAHTASADTASDQYIGRRDRGDDGINAWTFRPLTTDDFELLQRWLEQPAVARWWAHDTSPTAIEADFGPSVRGDKPTEVRIAELDGHPIGLIQRYWWHDYPDDRAEVDTGLRGFPTPVNAIPVNAMPVNAIPDSAVPDDTSPNDSVLDNPIPGDSSPDDPIQTDAIPDGAVSIDYFIGEADQLGRGRGPAMIDSFVTTTFADWAEATTIIVPVHADNRPSWRALEKAGFTIVGTVDLKPDNPIDDRRHVLARRDRNGD